MIVEKTPTGFSAFAVEYPVFTTALTITELIDNSYEAANLYFAKSKIWIQPVNLKFEFDLKQFFKYYRVINANYLADKIGMNPTLLSQYVQGHKKPSEAQTKKIFVGINKIGRELSEIKLFVK